MTGLEIGVIGMALCFPGARHKDEFWNNLKNGVESITFFSEEELLAEGFGAQLVQVPNYVKAIGLVEDFENFDAPFFCYTNREAEIMDPQIRLFHECAWEALEDAGYPPDTYDGLIGLYAGASPNFPWVALSLMSGSTMNLGFLTYLMIDKDYLSTRISYNLNLKGPSISLRTTCSTSLVAVHLAAQGLLSGECDMALAGGAALSIPIKSGYLHQEGMFESPDGHCRAFDRNGKGFVPGNGLGTVVLKRLDDCIRDRDHIYAVLKGSGINNDGTRKVGYTAPSVEGQADVIRAVHQIAEVEPESIGYIETHGTATPLGDSIEVEALKQAFNTDKKNFCAIGSVKTNIGHLDSAAGIAGFIKTALALKHRTLPPSLNFDIPNAQLELIDSPFYVNAAAQEWEHDGYPLRAGVSSFGIGGTNAHVVLEEAPPANHSPCQREYLLLPLSAKTEPALQQAGKNLAQFLRENPELNLPDTAYTLQVGRSPFKYRTMIICSNIDDAIQTLERQGITLAGDAVSPVFIFPDHLPDQAFQYRQMGLELYRQEPIFQAQMDRCFEIFLAETGYDLKNILYTRQKNNEDTFLTQQQILQPFIFIIRDSLAALLIEWGVKPAAVAGHEAGEYAAAHIAGILSLEDALSMATLKGILMQQTEQGTLTEKAALNELYEKLDTLSFNQPGIPYFSGKTGEYLTDEQISNPGYWLPRWKDTPGEIHGFSRLTEDQNTIFIEMGTGQAIDRQLAQHKNESSNHIAVGLLKEGAEETGYHHFLLNQTGRLWENGVSIDFSAITPDEERRRIPLPTYPFEKIPFKIQLPQWLKKLLMGSPDPSAPIELPGLSTVQTVNRTTQLKTLKKEQVEPELFHLIKSVFGIEKINPDDDLAGIGVDSLKIINLGVEIYKKFEIRLPLDRMFEASTPRALSQLIDEIVSGAPPLDTTGNTAEAAKTGESFSVDKLSAEQDIPGTILLTGATGFFGAHVLKSLLEKTNAQIHCLSRGNTLEEATQRSKEKLRYYFDNQLEEHYGNRIHFVKGDITQPRLGMEHSVYTTLSRHIDAVIHSAADVRHFGRYKDFETVNIDGTQQVIDFCFDNKKAKMHHISTIGVTGVPLQDITFKESDLDIGQHFEGDVYGRSKFEAEKLVYKARQQGLKASIYRVGNLTGRYRDGFFQKNIEENQLYNDLKTLIIMLMFPSFLEELDVELTPVDLCSDSLAHLVKLKDAAGCNFHLMNPFRLPFDKIVRYLNRFGYRVKSVDTRTFEQHITSRIKSGNAEKEIMGMFYRLQDDNSNGGSEPPRVRYSCIFTTETLKKTGFSWIELDYGYMSKLLKHSIDIGYL